MASLTRLWFFGEIVSFRLPLGLVRLLVGPLPAACIFVFRFCAAVLSVVYLGGHCTTGPVVRMPSWSLLFNLTVQLFLLGWDLRRLEGQTMLMLYFYIVFCMRAYRRVRMRVTHHSRK